jgi:hypothetical protein
MNKVNPVKLNANPQYGGDYSQGQKEVAVYYNSHESACPLSDHHFAESVAADMIEAVELYRRCTLVIGCYTPPYDPPLSAEAALRGGFITLDLLGSDQEPVCIGIEFGRFNKSGEMSQEGFDANSWKTNPQNPLSGGIYAINFDEAWRIVCIFTRIVEAREIILRYGC